MRSSKFRRYIRAKLSRPCTTETPSVDDNDDDDGDDEYVQNVTDFDDVGDDDAGDVNDDANGDDDDDDDDDDANDDDGQWQEVQSRLRSRRRFVAGRSYPFLP